jgi:kumamolisin
MTHPAQRPRKTTAASRRKERPETEAATSGPKNYRRLEGSELQHTEDERRVGRAEESERLSVTIVLRRRPDGPPVPEPDRYVRTPPSERPRMSEQAFAARYGAHPGEIERVAAFARDHGLTVDETNAARRTVVVSGTVGQFNEAFNVELHNYEREIQPSPRAEPLTETYRSYDGFIQVPAELAEMIVGVFGLDNRNITKRNAADPPSTNRIPMNSMRGLYDFPPNLAAGQDHRDLFPGRYGSVWRRFPGKRHHRQFPKPKQSALGARYSGGRHQR